MTDKFYYDYEEDCDEYAIMEKDGGYELGVYFDVARFWVASVEGAQDAVDLLNDLYGRVPQSELLNRPAYTF